MDVPVERFDPLLRDLLCYDLVVETEPGHWHLRAPFAARLAALAVGQRPTTAPVLRIGVSCASCHVATVTRLHEGRFLCEACIGATALANQESRAEEAAGPRPSYPSDLSEAVKIPVSPHPPSSRVAPSRDLMDT